MGKDMKNTDSLKSYIILVIAIVAVNIIIKITVHPPGVNNPIYYRSGACIVGIYLLGHVLYAWKSNLSELFKRALFAVPFALIFSVLAYFVWGKYFWSIMLGAILFLFLLLKAQNWKQHFFVILIPAYLCLPFLKYLWMPFPESQNMMYLYSRSVLIFSGFIILYSFTAHYLTKLEQTESPDLKNIFIRSMKFNIAVILSFFSYLLVDYISNQLHVDFTVQLSVNILLSILYLAIFYRYDLFLDENSGRLKKENKIKKLENELHEFYMNERQKLQK